MDKIYLVVIDIYNEEENSIVNICTTREKAEELVTNYTKNSSANGYHNGNSRFKYHIDEVELDSSKDILWDCYENSYYVEKYGKKLE